jgi:hypothetical protein
MTLPLYTALQGLWMETFSQVFKIVLKPLILSEIEVDKLCVILSVCFTHPKEQSRICVQYSARN